MWYEKSNKEVSIITSLKQDLFCFSSQVPIAKEKSFQNPNLVNNLSKKSSISDNLSKNYRSNIYYITNFIKENCPKVIPYYQSDMVYSDITDSQADIHLENRGIIAEDKLPLEVDKDAEEELHKTNANELVIKCNDHVSRIENSKENQNSISINKALEMKETETKPCSVDDMTTNKMTCQQRTSSICESEDSFIVFEGSEYSTDEGDTESDEDSDDEDEPDNCIVNENNIERNYHVYLGSDINHKDYIKNDLLNVNDNTVLIKKKTDNEEPLRFNNSNKQRFPSLCESEDSFIVFERTDDDDDDDDEGDSVDEDSDESEYDTELSSNNISQPQVHTKTKKKTEEEYNNHSNTNLKHYRQRIPSICESEDSFILFERTDNENEVDDSVNSESSSWEQSYDQVDACNYRKCENFPETKSTSKIKQKKVSFAPGEKLCKVYPMIKWSYAYQAARKGPWEMHARDRTRFMDRINRTENELKSVLNLEHRDNVYKLRFAKDN